MGNIIPSSALWACYCDFELFGAYFSSNSDSIYAHSSNGFTRKRCPCGEKTYSEVGTTKSYIPLTSEKSRNKYFSALVTKAEGIWLSCSGGTTFTSVTPLNPFSMPAALSTDLYR